MQGRLSKRKGIIKPKPKNTTKTAKTAKTAKTVNCVVQINKSYNKISIKNKRKNSFFSFCLDIFFGF